MLKDTIAMFDSRLATLSMLLDQAATHFGNDEYLALKLVDDMLPMSTQIVFTCNQPHNLAQWLAGQELTTMDTEVSSTEAAKALIAQARSEAAAITVDDAGVPAEKRLDFGDRYVDLSGVEYISDFLVPNFYFHFVTAYDILRANGLQIGKANYMAHLLGRVKLKSEG